MNTLIYGVIYRNKKVNGLGPILTLRNSPKCVHLKENIVPHGNMKKVVELVLCLSGANASIERVSFRTN
jgi:hypothetical protein